MADRDPLTGRFALGHAKTGGRPKGFAGVARMIMEATEDGAELVEWALATWRDPNRSHAERAAAHAWLSDRGLGKAVAMHELAVTAEVTPRLPDNLGSMSLADRLQWFRVHRPDLQLAAPSDDDKE